MTSRTFWKTYFYLFLALTVVAIVAMPFLAPEGTTPWDYWRHAPLYVVQLVAIFGLAYWRRLASRLAWQIVFAATVASELRTFYQMGSPDFVWIIALMYAFRIPLWVGLFLYAFRSKGLWASAT